MGGLWSEPLRTNREIIMAERLVWGQDYDYSPRPHPNPILPP